MPVCTLEVDGFDETTIHFNDGHSELCSEPDGENPWSRRYLERRGRRERSVKAALVRRHCERSTGTPEAVTKGKTSITCSVSCHERRGGSAFEGTNHPCVNASSSTIAPEEVDERFYGWSEVYMTLPRGRCGSKGALDRSEKSSRYEKHGCEKTSIRTIILIEYGRRQHVGAVRRILAGLEFPEQGELGPHRSVKYARECA